MLTINSLATKSGTTAAFPHPGVLCVVGGNNVGKSQLLRDVIAEIGSTHPRLVVLRDLDYKVHLTEDIAEEWLFENFGFDLRYSDLDRISGPTGGRRHKITEMLEGASRDEWHEWAEWLIQNLDASERSELAANFPDDDPSSSLMKLLRDGAKEAELSDLCYRTFGFHLTLDRVNGEVCLRVGSPDVKISNMQRPTLEYSDAVLALPPLNSQGDGVKNYLGMVLHMMTSSAGVTVIDEPEAFLHPAQAKALGRHLGSEIVSQSRQLLTATHDRDFILGLLESGVDVTFLRLDRRENLSFSKALDARTVREIWDRPELRYSNVLQGLFHRVVVVCEADADCRWYAAVLDKMIDLESAPSEEVLFLPAGGKTGVKNCVSALDAIDVDCYAILDFDALLDPDQLSLLLQSFGSKEHDGQIIERARAVSKGIGIEERKHYKQTGIAGLSQGDKQRLAKEASVLLAKRHVLLVEIGEMESFHGDLGGKGATWVTRALERGRHQACPAAEALLRPVLAALAFSSTDESGAGT